MACMSGMVGYSRLVATPQTYSAQVVSSNFSMSINASASGICKLVTSSAVTSLKRAARRHDDPRMASSQKPALFESHAVRPGRCNLTRIR
eukprot:4175388-Pyramimonas_sp.AAC.2